MERQPDPEYCARIVLDVFVSDFRCRADGSLPMQSIAVWTRKRNLNQLDLEAGVAYAVQQRWLETIPSGQHRLTQEGFDES